MLPFVFADARGRSFSWRQRSARRSGFDIGRTGKSTGIGVRRWSRRTSRFTSNARVINHFESAESRSGVQPFVLWRLFVCRGLTWTADPVDHTRSRRSEQIGMDQFWKSSDRDRAGRRGASEQMGSKCPSKIRTECCQSLLLMPKAEVLAGDKSPRVGPGSGCGGHGGSQMGHAS